MLNLTVCICMRVWGGQGWGVINTTFFPQLFAKGQVMFNDPYLPDFVAELIALSARLKPSAEPGG